MTEQLQQLLLKSIPDMPTRCNSVRIRSRCVVLHRKLDALENELDGILRECPERTGCYLRYGAGFSEPFGHGFPISREIDPDGWEHALADFYADEANKLLKERDDLLRVMYRLTSQYYKMTGYSFPGMDFDWHMRKPDFESARQ